MGPFVLIIVAVVLAVVSAVTGFFWTWPFAGLALLIGLGYLLMQRQGRGSPITIEQGRRKEPTGRPRASRSDVTTTNERVGQG